MMLKKKSTQFCCEKKKITVATQIFRDQNFSDIQAFVTQGQGPFMTK